MDTLLEVLTEALIKAAIIVIPILFTVLITYLVKFLQAQMAKLEREGKDIELLLLQEFTQIVVLAAEQLLEHNEQNAKFDFAEESLLALAAEAGIPLTSDQALLLIEGTVHAIQNELPRPNSLYIEGTLEDFSEINAT
jgi:hypothetical protein